MSQYIEPTEGRFTEMVKLLLSTIYVSLPLAILIYQFHTQGQVDSLVLFIVLIFIIASAYVIYGQKTIEAATDSASEILDEQSESGEGNSESGGEQ